MKKVYLTVVSLLLLSIASFAQGTFISNVVAGNWNTAGSWLIIAGSDGDGIPDSDDDVYIQVTHIITLTGNEACNNLNVSTGTTSATVGGESLLQLQANTLSLNGYLRCYFANLGATPGTPTTTNTVTNISITAASAGKLQFVGNTRNITQTGEWSSANPGATTALAVEIAMTAGQTATMQTGIKASGWTITSGTLVTGTNRIAIDNGTTGFGDVSIANGATVISSATGTGGNAVIGRTGTTSGGILTVSGSLILNGAAPTVAMTTINFPGIVEYAGTAQSLLALTNSGVTPNIYFTLILSGSLTKTLTVNTSINSLLSLQGSAFLALGAFTLVYGAGQTLEYKGSVAQLTGTAPAEWPTLNGPASLVINNALGVTLNATGGRAIGGALTLTNGILKTTTLLTMNAGSVVAAVSNTSFVDSTMRKIGNTDFIFPVGRIGIGYVPIQIVTFGSGAATDEFTAAYSRSSAEALGTITVPAQVGLNHVSRVDYWKLDHIGTITADVILYWTAGSSSNGSGSYIDNLGNLSIAHFNGTQWDSYAIPATVTGGSTFTAGSIKWQLASAFGSFSLASSTISNPLPINLNYLNGFKQGNNNLLNWKVTCTNNPSATMSVQRSTDGRNYNSITTVFADALRCQQPFDYTDNNAPTGLNYYRLKMVDANGKITYSAPIAILNKETGFDIVGLSPTLVNTKAELNVTAAQKTTMTVVITDIAGKQVQKIAYNLIAGSNKFTVNAAGLSAGTYQITGYTADGKSRTIRFVKQ